MAFAWKKTVTIDHTKCGGSNSSNFPVLVSVTDADLKTVGNGGFVQNASGFDIVFYSDITLTTKLDHEIERYVASTGEIIMWVRVGTLDSAVDTVFYMGFGDSGISTSQENKTGVWNSNFKSVQHLADGSTLSLTDSTTLTTATNHSSVAATGKIGGGCDLPWYDLGAVHNFTTGPFTLSCWVKFNSLASGPVLFYKGQFQANGYYLQPNNNSNNLNFTTNQSGANQGTQTNASEVTTGVWYYVSIIRNGTAVKICVNGVDKATLPASHSNPTSSSDNFQVGTYNAGSNLLDAIVDEVRVSDTNRSVDWELASYNNQNDPGTFMSFSSKVATANVARNGDFFFGNVA